MYQGRTRYEPDPKQAIRRSGAPCDEPSGLLKWCPRIPYDPVRETVPGRASPLQETRLGKESKKWETSKVKRKKPLKQ